MHHQTKEKKLGKKQQNSLIFNSWLGIKINVIRYYDHSVTPNVRQSAPVSFLKKCYNAIQRSNILHCSQQLGKSEWNSIICLFLRKRVRNRNHKVEMRLNQKIFIRTSSLFRKFENFSALRKKTTLALIIYLFGHRSVWQLHTMIKLLRKNCI